MLFILFSQNLAYLQHIDEIHKTHTGKIVRHFLKRLADDHRKEHGTRRTSTAGMIKSPKYLKKFDLSPAYLASQTN